MVTSTYLQQSQSGYVRYHAPRYETLLKLLHKLYTGVEKILDVGISPFNEIAYQSLKTNIDTIGFIEDKPTETGFNYQFDLNKAQHEADWRRDIPQYDIIVFSEVLEHLHTSPKLVLAFLRSLLKKGGRIIIQTPNATVLHKRLQMLLGANPYNLIRDDITNPAHFREYTARELEFYCRDAGFDIEVLSFENYFDYRYSHHSGDAVVEHKLYGVVNLFYSLVLPSMRPGLSTVVRLTQ
jgi:SAM-dependent methyltransferase